MQTSQRNEDAYLQELKTPAMAKPPEDKRRDRGTGDQSNPLLKKPTFQAELASVWPALAQGSLVDGEKHFPGDGKTFLALRYPY